MPRTLSVAESLPLTPRVFHLLLALVDGEAHGYAIMKEVELRSEGRVRIGPGTLYEAIDRLEAQGLIAETQKGAAAFTDERHRRFYRLTAFGHEVLRAEAQRLAELVSFARRKRLLDKPRLA
jgi:DNA-binding PadR family transcriptional regulator